MAYKFNIIKTVIALFGNSNLCPVMQTVRGTMNISRLLYFNGFMVRQDMTVYGKL